MPARLGFVVGNVVQLKSSPIKMTVFLVSSDGMFIYCVWFDFAGNLNRATFHPEVLEHVERYPN